MLAAFIGNAKAGELESVLKTSTTSSPGHLKQFLLLSKDAFELFASGALSMEAMPFGKKVGRQYEALSSYAKLPRIPTRYVSTVWQGQRQIGCPTTL